MTIKMKETIGINHKLFKGLQEEKRKTLEDKEADKQVRKDYHNKLKFIKKNYLNQKIGKFKGNGKNIDILCMT